MCLVLVYGIWNTVYGILYGVWYMVYGVRVHSDFPLLLLLHFLLDQQFQIILGFIELPAISFLHFQDLVCRLRAHSLAPGGALAFCEATGWYGNFTIFWSSGWNAGMLVDGLVLEMLR